MDNPQPLATYSFLDVAATLSGPGGSISLGAGSANSEEGISIEFDEETGTMQKGADGSVVHSLHAVKSGRGTVRLLKTSPVNSLLSSLYNFQRTSSLFYGKNVLVVSNPVTGDVYTCQQVAFAKHPANAWSKDSNVIEWDFNIGVIDPVLGSLQTF
jgi:hypothetical protein